LEELLSGKVSPHTLSLLMFVVDQDRARQLPEILEEVARLAAAAKDSVIAEVRSAVPLDENQQKELARGLSRSTGKNVTVKVLVDPSVIGGISATVGDTVIDGTVKRRLEQLKEQVRG
jgi:F-type H+-transporting ATPase subunit delta